jgi:hypothetical protein
MYHLNTQDFQALISAKLSTAQISTKDLLLQMEKLKVSHIHKLDLTAMLTMVSYKNLVHFTYHSFTQVFQDSMLRNLNTAQISMKG